MSEHTPGPWSVRQGVTSELPSGRFLIRDDNGEIITEVVPLGSKGTVANAHLIAAAPDLLAALDALHRQVADSMKFTREADGWHAVDEELARVMEQASSAIDKAEGRSP